MSEPVHPTPVGTPPDTTPTPDLRTWQLNLFTQAWALAALFHLANADRLPAERVPVLLILSTLLAVTAAGALLRPHDRRWLVALCGVLPLQAWQETPHIGNHWVLAALISLAVCAVSVAVRRGPGRWNTLGRPLRATLLVAYSFAAFAKINAAFLDPAVSCATYFHDQLVDSWGLTGLRTDALPWLRPALGPLAMMIELTVAVTLTWPRTRRAGLVLAGAFHWLLAMDLNQHFWDFSSVLFAGFVLFLDDGQLTQLRRWLTRPAFQVSHPQLLRLTLALLGGVVTVLYLANSPALPQVGHVLWWVYGTPLAVLLGALFTAPYPQGRPNKDRTPRAALLLPALALINGLSPYLELKTSYSWNMYSNLRTVGGHTNHLLLPGTLDLTGAQRDLVFIVSSGDPQLVRLQANQYALTYAALRSYAHRFPETDVTYRHAGTVHEARRLGDDTAGQGRVSVLEEKLHTFRAVDLMSQERCQPVYTQAR